MSRCKRSGRLPGLIPRECVNYPVSKSLDNILMPNGFDVIAGGATLPRKRAPGTGAGVQQGIWKLIAPTSLALYLCPIARPQS